MSIAKSVLYALGGMGAYYLFDSLTSRPNKTASSPVNTPPKPTPKPKPPVVIPEKYSLPYQHHGSLDALTPTLQDVAGAVTGDPDRWPEIPAANPDSGIDFTNLDQGVPFKLPMSWSVYIDQNGEAEGDGTMYPVCGTTFPCPKEEE